MRIAARVCAPQPKFLYIINRMMLKNDSNAVLITLVLSWVNNFAKPILYLHLSVLQKLKAVRVGYGSLNERSWAVESI